MEVSTMGKMGDLTMELTMEVSIMVKMVDLTTVVSTMVNVAVNADLTSPSNTTVEFKGTVEHPIKQEDFGVTQQDQLEPAEIFSHLKDFLTILGPTMPAEPNCLAEEEEDLVAPLVYVAASKPGTARVDQRGMNISGADVKPEKRDS
ncbi:uncharacterized protein LOC111707601 [Eurytemora carolleeae]|uniref:uncharacterized protein LOC111707601 n=1 Tax=Eurytemora carolleeae TaxID=1294199 RepID=UPI000C764F40|nr:uncharacterized protein LOC111707601 [Eurytemora carolleeae]|eukprot:XP_023336503.1 uncharacterized protein LOC111707601 [Eurytemora affinis]